MASCWKQKSAAFLLLQTPLTKKQTVKPKGQYREWKKQNRFITSGSCNFPGWTEEMKTLCSLTGNTFTYFATCCYSRCDAESHERRWPRYLPERNITFMWPVFRPVWPIRNILSNQREECGFYGKEIINILWFHLFLTYPIFQYNINKAFQQHMQSFYCCFEGSGKNNVNLSQECLNLERPDFQF